MEFLWWWNDTIYKGKTPPSSIRSYINVGCYVYCQEDVDVEKVNKLLCICELKKRFLV